MPEKKPSKQEIEALELQIKNDQDKSIKENERRVRISGTFKDAVKKMSKTPPISNKDLKEWAKKQREESS